MKCHRETKESTPVAQLVQCVSGVQVKAADLTQERGESQEEEHPRMRGGRWEGSCRIPMSHQGCHSREQVVQQRKFSWRRAEGRFLLWFPGCWKSCKSWVNLFLPVLCRWLPSLQPSVLLSLLCWLSTPFAAVSLKRGLWKCGCYYYVCVQEGSSQFMCASPSFMLIGRQRTSALNSPLTPPPPLSLSACPLLPLLLLLHSADINTQGTGAKIPGKVVRILGG